LGLTRGGGLMEQRTGATATMAKRYVKGKPTPRMEAIIEDTLFLFACGETIENISTRLNLKAETIERYFIAAGLERPWKT